MDSDNQLDKTRPFTFFSADILNNFDQSLIVLAKLTVEDSAFYFPAKNTGILSNETHSTIEISKWSSGNLRLPGFINTKKIMASTAPYTLKLFIYGNDIPIHSFKGEIFIHRVNYINYFLFGFIFILGWAGIIVFGKRIDPNRVEF